jgi:hypothetical protein
MTDLEHAIHPEFAARGSFEHLCLGRSPKTHDAKIRLANYIDEEALPPIPAHLDLTKGITFPMYGNDRLGDCTCAAVGHLIQIWTAAVGAPVTPPDSAIEHLYIPETGDEDTGRVETDVLDYWKKHGIDTGDKIIGYAAIDPGVTKHIKLGIALFGGVYAGVALPLTAQTQKEWHVVGNPDDPSSPAAPGSWGGHAIPYGGYTKDKLVVVTWGATLLATLHWDQTYCDEAYVVVTKDWLNAQGKSPAGLDLAQLETDLNALRT